MLGDDLAAILAATIPPDKKAVVVGHSFGGSTIMAWAARYPGDVARYASAVLLADTVGERLRARTELVPFAGRYALLRRPLLGLALHRIPIPSSRALRNTFRNAVMNPDASRAEVDFMFAIVSGAAVDVRSRWSVGLLHLGVLDGLANLKVPVTVLVGQRDRLTPPVMSRQIADILRTHGSLHRLVELPGVGHCTNLEAPARFDAQVRELLALERPHSEAVG